jgi:hypothetical protein
MFHLGQMVVAKRRDGCGSLPPGGLPRPILGQLPVNGQIYTIRGFDPRGGDGLYLEEVVMPNGPLGYEWTFHRGNFRPVRKTDISVFREAVESVRNRTLVPADVGER